jgi:hypothetical protein
MLTFTAPAAALSAAPDPATLSDPAGEVDTPPRDRHGLAVPYGVYGNTSRGRLRVRRGALRVPADLGNVVVLAGHRGNGADPTGVGFLTGTRETDAGLEVDVHFAATPAGDAALLEADQRVRAALSVELDNLELAADEVTGADLVALALIPIPAFTSARLAAEFNPEEITVLDTDTPTPDDTAPAVPELVAALPPEIGRPGPPARSMRDVAAVASALSLGARTPELAAALADITFSGGAAAHPPQFVGELWAGVAYQRQLVPLVQTDALTSMTVSGWVWTVPPTVAPYTGDKAAVPSNPATIGPVTLTAERLAGAHDIDRAFRDFGDTGFFESYFRAMAESYAKQSDGALAADLLAAAGTVTPAAGSDAWETYMAAYYAAAAYAPPSFAVVSARWAQAAGAVSNLNTPAAVGTLPTPIVVPDAVLGAIDVLVGNRSGATFFELGGSPIRVEVVNLPNGGIDAGVFGYFATNVHATAAFKKATIPAVV